MADEFSDFAAVVTGAVQGNRTRDCGGTASAGRKADPYRSQCGGGVASAAEAMEEKWFSAN